MIPSCILLKINKTSVIPIPSINLNCILSRYSNILIWLSRTLSTIFIACSSNFTPLYDPQLIKCHFPLTPWWPGLEIGLKPPVFGCFTNTIAPLPIGLESCLNPQKIRQVFFPKSAFALRSVTFIRKRLLLWCQLLVALSFSKFLSFMQ